MKKLLYVLPVAALVAVSVFYLSKKTEQIVQGTGIEKPNDKKLAELNQQEELEQKAREEFLKTYDPALGYVPTDRLLEGENRAAEIMKSIGINSPSNMSAVTWTERGPNNIGGRTRGFIFDANDATGNTALAGGVGGGLWRTTNFKTASTWTQIASINQNLAVTCIAQDPQTLGTMYAGTGEGAGNADAIRGIGIYKSTDFGLTWTLLANTTGAPSSDNFSYVQKILVYNNPTHDVYAACRSIFCNRGGLMRSTNGGTNWTRVLGTAGASCGAASPDTRIYDIEQSLSGDLWVSSATVGTANSGRIWKSPAGGTVGNAGTWVDKTPPTAGTSWQRIELACSPTNNDRIYALLQGTANAIGGIRRTDDGAATPATSWNNVNNATLWCDAGTSSSVDFSRNQSWYDLMLAIKPDDDATVFAGGVDIMKTTNTGTNWTQITQWASGCAALPYVHADIHNIQYLPGSTTEFVVACDGGLFYTTDGGTTFTDKNTGYNITQYYSCAIHPTAASNYMLAGSQDNGTHKFTTAGMNTVTTPTGGDGGNCIIDQKNPLQQITNFTGTTLNLSNNGGTSFTYMGSFGTDRFINPGDFDTASSTTPGLSTAAFYYCGGAVQNFRRVNVNFSALSVSSFSFAAGGAVTANHSVSAIKVDPNTANRIWVAMSTADNAGAFVVPQLYYINSANTGAPVSNAITLPGTITSGQYISSIDIENGDASHILITISNYGVASVYESTDLGANWTSLDNNGVNLPDVPVRWGMFIPSGYTQAPSAVGGILLGTELGVWGTNTISGATTPFAQNNTGMGNVRVDMIKYRGSDKTVAVATHGRGLFTGQLLNPLPVNFVWFKGTPLDNANRLAWRVNDYGDNAGFEVERKYNGENQFIKVGYVAAVTPASSISDYGYDDNRLDVSKQTAIYRLKQIDKNGASKYSDQILLKRSLVGKMIQFVSANTNNLLIRVGYRPQIKNISVSIIDGQGRVILTQTQQYQDVNIDISKIPKGAYFVKVLDVKTGEQYVNKFIK